jgi:hypothetical protein
MGLAPYKPALPEKYRKRKQRKPPAYLANHFDPEIIGKLTPSGKALDSLMSKAFKDTERRLAVLLGLSRAALSDFQRWKEAHPAPEPLPENVADVLRGFVNLLGGTDA